MKKDRHNTAFYIETILLIVVFMAIIIVLTSVFGAGRAQSSAARRLTLGVGLAENAAEMVSASDSPQQLFAMLNDNENAYITGDGTKTFNIIVNDAGSSSKIIIEARYDDQMKPDPEGKFRVQVTWEPEQQSAGDQASGTSAGVSTSQTGLMEVSGADAGGTMITSHITVLYEGLEEPVYSLETGVYAREVD